MAGLYVNLMKHQFKKGNLDTYLEKQGSVLMSSRKKKEKDPVKKFLA